MRIVGGALRGMQLLSPTTAETRPTADRVRESLFNILTHGDYPPFEGALVMDGFAGTGALGLEAFSRGAAKVFFVENERMAAEICFKNIQKARGEKNCVLFKNDICAMAKQNDGAQMMDYIFLDPPYKKNLAFPALISLKNGGWLGVRSVVVIEAHKKFREAVPDDFKLCDERIYGETMISVYAGG